jgi:hypothetical protein
MPGKCTTVIVVNWAEIGRSMTDRKFRVQSSLFRSLCRSQRARKKKLALPRELAVSQFAENFLLSLESTLNLVVGVGKKQFESIAFRGHAASNSNRSALEVGKSGLPNSNSNYY